MTGQPHDKLARSFLWKPERAAAVLRAGGRTAATREKLLRVLQTRFWGLADEIRIRVLAADIETRDVWFDRALTAVDPDAVFTG